MVEQPIPVRPRSFLDLIEHPPTTPPYWIDGGILPRGGCMILGGQAKLGKTWFQYSMIESLVFGLPLFGLEEWSVKEPCRILMIDRELGVHEFYDRILPPFSRYINGPGRQRFADNAWFMTKDDASRHINLSTDRGRAILMDALAIVKPHVLFLDPIGKLHAGDENDASSMNQLFLTLEAIRGEHVEREMAIVFSHHFGKLASSKDSGREPLDPYNFRGSTRWYDDPDTILTARKTREYRPSAIHKWWECECLFTCRTSAGYDPFAVHVNESNDRRVWFNRWLGGGSSEPPPKPTQQRIADKLRALKAA